VALHEPIQVPSSVASKMPRRSLPVSSHLPYYLRSFSSSSESVTQEDDSGNRSLNQELSESPGPESAGGEILSDLWEEVVQTGDSETVFRPVDEEEKFDVDEEVEKVKSAIDSAGGVERCFTKMWYGINEEVVSRVLEESPKFSPEKLFEFFSVINEMYPSSVTRKTVSLFVNAIISSDEVSKQDIYKLWDFIKKLDEREKGLVHTEALNGLLSVLSKLEEGMAALEVFEKFGDFSCVHDSDSSYFTIEALGKINKFKWAWTVCEKMLDSGNLPDEERTGKVISIFCRGKMAKEAQLVYLMAKEKKLTVNTSVLDVLVSALSRRDATIKEALKMLDEYKGDALRNAGCIFGLVLRGLCWAKDGKEAKTLILRMVESGPKPGNAAFNYAITALSKEGDMEDAMELMKLMVNRGLRPDMYTYIVIMSGYAKYGMMKEAHDILHEAKKRHKKLKPVCYHIIIRGYCKLEQFDKAIECLHQMKEDGITPNLDEYNKLIQSLCLKAIDWRRAEALLVEMENSRLHLNDATCSLISAVKELEQEVVKSDESTEA
jgi:pentatricopeptide repeat protein